MFGARGFKPLVTAQCVYANLTTGVLIVGHVDDFFCQGSKAELVRLLQSLQEEYECGGELLGPDIDEARVIILLGRKISYTNDGLEWEGDDKHARSFVEKLGLSKSKVVVTPGVKRDEVGEERRSSARERPKNIVGLLLCLIL